METSVKIKKLHENFNMPKQAHSGDAGFDLPCMAGFVLHAGERMVVPCGFAMAMSPGWEAQVRPRSGLAAKNGITVVNSPGTIDHQYRGEVKVVLLNTSSEDKEFEAGDRIAQMVIAKVPEVSFEEVDELDDTERGSGGFGSTGK